MTLPIFTNIQMGWSIETRKPLIFVSKNDQKLRWFGHTFVEGPSNMPFFITASTDLGMLWGNVRQHLWVPFRIRFPLKEVFPFKVRQELVNKISLLSWALRLRRPTIVESSTSPPSGFQVLPSVKSWDLLMPPWGLGICVPVEGQALTVRVAGTTTARTFLGQTVGLMLREPTTWQRAWAKVDQLEIWPPICKWTRLMLTLASSQTRVWELKSLLWWHILGYDKEEIVASRTLFWVGVEVVFRNLFQIHVLSSSRYRITHWQQMVLFTSCWSKQTWWE